MPAAAVAAWTQLLARRLPRGRVVALDGSPAMVDAVRQRLARFGDLVEYVVADLGELPLIESGRRDPVDRDVPLGARPRRGSETRFGSQTTRVALVAQCGGVGNIASIQRVLATIGDGWLGDVYFAKPLDTVRRLEAAGFVDPEVWLTDEPTRFETRRAARGVPADRRARQPLARLPASEHEAFVRAVAVGLHEPG